jgi:hypothetical protein
MTSFDDPTDRPKYDLGASFDAALCVFTEPENTVLRRTTPVNISWRNQIGSHPQLRD